jgi:hypothetical protein
MRTQSQKTLRQALEAGPVERIEIELMPNAQFRWKLWSDGRMKYCANGHGVASEINAMIQSTDLITRTMMGVEIDGQ